MLAPCWHLHAGTMKHASLKTRLSSLHPSALPIAQNLRHVQQQPGRQVSKSQSSVPSLSRTPTTPLSSCSSYSATLPGSSSSDNNSPDNSDPSSQSHNIAPLPALVRTCFTALTCAVLCAAWLCVSTGSTSGVTSLASLSISSDPSMQGMPFTVDKDTRHLVCVLTITSRSPPTNLYSSLCDAPPAVTSRHTPTPTW